MGIDMSRLRVALAIGLMLTLGLVSSSGQEKKVEEKKAAKGKKTADRPVPGAPARAVFGQLDVQRGLVNDAQLQAWEQAYGPQLRQMLRTELHFMRLVTQPTKQEYEKIAADTEPAIKDAIRSLLIAANTGNVGGQADARGPIAAVVARSVRANLSADQAAAYEKELEQRTAARKRAAVLNLVAMIDKSLMLNSEQREEITQVLIKNWTESWGQTQMLMMAGQYMPTLPDAKILPILTDAQREIWRGVPRTNVRFGFNISAVPIVPIDDEVWDGDPPAKKRDRAGGGATPKTPERVKAGK
jgi:hypothetical protein